MALCLVAWLSLLPARGVWAPDEARYAEVTREMRQSQSWLIPKLNGRLYTQKPPLFFDAARIASLPAKDVPEWAVKVPSLAGALLTLLFLGLIAARLAGPKALWLAPLLLGTMVKFSWQAQFGQIDMMLTALVVAQVYVGLRFSSGQGRRWGGIALLAFLGTAGVLTKGPVGCLLPWLILLVYFSARRDWKTLVRLGLHYAVPLVLILCGAWLLYAGWSQGWDYPHGLLFKQSVQRYFEPWHHKAPFYYFLGILFTDGLPFSVLLVPAIAPLIRGSRWKEPGALLPLVWMAVYLVFFSLSPAKRSVYILPLFPAMALLLAYAFLNVEQGAWSFKGFGRTLGGLALLFAVLGVVGISEVPAGFRYLAGWLAVGAALLVAGCLTAWVLGARGKTTAGISAMALLSLLFFALTGGVVARVLDQVKTPRSLGEAIHRRVERGAEVGIFPSLVPSINYYGECTTRVFGLRRKKEAMTFLSSGGDRLLIVKEDDWGSKTTPGIKTLERSRIGRARYLLLEWKDKTGGEKNAYQPAESAAATTSSRSGTLKGLAR